MLKAIPAPRAELSPYAPKMIRFMIDPEKIREVIGKGGSVIQKITADTNTKDRHRGRRLGLHRRHQLCRRRERPAR